MKIQLASGETLSDSKCFFKIHYPDKNIFIEIEAKVVKSLREKIIIGCDTITKFEINLTKTIHKQNLKTNLCFVNCADEQQTKEHDDQNLLNSIDIGDKKKKIENIQNFKNLINKYHEVWSNKKKRLKINL